MFKSTWSENLCSVIHIWMRRRLENSQWIARISWRVLTKPYLIKPISPIRLRSGVNSCKHQSSQLPKLQSKLLNRALFRVSSYLYQSGTAAPPAWHRTWPPPAATAAPPPPPLQCDLQQSLDWWHSYQTMQRRRQRLANLPQQDPHWQTMVTRSSPVEILYMFHTEVFWNRHWWKMSNLERATCLMAISSVINNFVELFIIRNESLYHNRSLFMISEGGFFRISCLVCT